MLSMSRADALQNSNSKAIMTSFQPAFITRTSGKEDNLHILHVDDDQSVAEISKQILMAENNFEVETASSVDEAFQKLQRQTYDAIISDYEMPQKNGLDFLKELRQQHKDIPFILFTGKGREEVVVKALNLGADSYINKNGSPETVYCELADAINKTVKRKKAERDVLEQKEKFRTIFENIHDVITYVDTHGKILDVNDRIEELLGYKPEEIIGKSFVTLGLIKFGDAPKLLKLFLGSIRKRKEEKILLLELKHKNGSRVSVEVGTRFIRDNKGKIVSIVNIFRDVTESKKAGTALVESEEKFRKVFAIGHDAYLVSTLKESTIIDVNERFAEMFGYTRQEAIGESAIELGLWANLSDREKIAKQLKSKGKIENLEIECKRKSGESFPVLLSVSLLEANNQQLVLSTVRDLSNSRHTEDALKESEEKFRNLAEESPNIIFINCKGRIVYANKKSEDITGYTREELYSSNFNFLSLSTPEYVESIKSSYSRHLRGEAVPSYEFGLLTKDGRKVDVIITSKLIDYKGERAILGIVTDISELKKAEEAVRKSEDEYSSLFNNMIDGFAYCQMIFDEAGKPVDFIYLQINDAFEKITGLKRDLVVGKKATAAIPGIKEANPELFEIYGRVALTCQKEKFEVFFKPLRMWLNVSVYCPRKGYFAAAFEDITEHKKAEENLNQTMDELVSVNEKLGVVGSLTRHDVRNKLSVISGNIYLLKKKHSDSPEIINRLGEMEKACKSIANILDFAKMYEQIGVEEQSFIDVEKTIGEAVALFSGSPNVKIVNECPGLTVLADSFLRQMYYNLIDNSVKHGKRVTKISMHYEKTVKEELNLIYEDDGVGIPVQNKSQLFKEGFSTGGSSGYGLYLIRKMMEVYGWSIQENGTPDMGAKFTITIPKLNKVGKENYQIAK